MRPLVIPSLCEDLFGDYLKGAQRGLRHFFPGHIPSDLEPLGDPLGVPGASHRDEVPANLGGRRLLTGSRPEGCRIKPVGDADDLTADLEREAWVAAHLHPAGVGHPPSGPLRRR